MRHPQWPERLTETLNSFADAPFVWGQSDCFDLLSLSIEAVTGEPFFAECRGQYDGHIGAARLLKSHGFESMADLVASVGDEINPSHATRGDVGVVYDPRGIGVTSLADGVGYASAVCAGRLWACRKEGSGIVWAPRSSITRAWRVG